MVLSGISGRGGLAGLAQKRFLDRLALVLQVLLEDARQARPVARAREAGVNFIDTADAYSQGVSEEITGRLIAKDRTQWVLATKAGSPMGDDPACKGLGRKWLMRAIDDSLGRLKTDYVDVYYLHKPDPEAPLEETLSAIGGDNAASQRWGCDGVTILHQLWHRLPARSDVI